MNNSGKIVVVNDKMQKNYKYILTQPIGKNFHSEFKPELKPQEMLSLGVFGGKYITDCKNEFPKKWFIKAKLNSEFSDPKLNFFGITASQPLKVWKQKGWIHPDDPRGWFQWYCRYYMGRRIEEEDARQIKRWKAMTRHIAQVKKNCVKGDISCRPKQNSRNFTLQKIIIKITIKIIPMLLTAHL